MSEHVLDSEKLTGLASNAFEIARLKAELFDERAKVAKLEAEKAELARMLGPDWSVFVGPCPHGSDPWTRCDDCGGKSQVTVMADVTRTAQAREQRLRDALRGLVEAWDKHVGKPLLTVSGKPSSLDRARAALEAP